MRLKESADIAAAAADIWPLVAVPANLHRWNPRIVSVTRVSSLPVTLGERFQAVSTMAGKPLNTTVEVVACQPPLLITYRLNMEVNGIMRFMDQTYKLQAHRNQTRVFQISDLRGAGFPWWARLIFWVVMLIGKPVEEPFMNRLKRLVEAR